MPHAVYLKSRPRGEASVNNFDIRQLPDRQPTDGELLIATRYISVDPYLRGRMNEGPSYVAPFALDAPVESGAVGEVVSSSQPAFKAGDIVSGYLPWQDTVLLDGDSEAFHSLQKIDTDGISMTAYLGILGMPGQTAWVGLSAIGQPREGETVFVSAASGAVGSTVGQIARQLGCRVVGAAGTDEKVAYVLDELGFDGAFNYRKENDLDAALKRLCPDGIDINYENVGGPVSEAVFKRLRRTAAVAGAGQEHQDTGFHRQRLSRTARGVEKRRRELVTRGQDQLSRKYRRRPGKRSRRADGRTGRPKFRQAPGAGLASAKLSESIKVKTRGR
jgi:NADPH-dependent curcumin reductase CurA